MKNEILLIPDKKDVERDQLAEIWKQKGGEVKRVGKFWIKPEVGDKKVSLYGYDSFCLVLAQILELELLMPKDEIIADLEKQYTKRAIKILSIKEVANLEYPIFVKPVTPKLFKAQVYDSVDQLKSELKDISDTEDLICSTIVEIEKEVRSFILNKAIKDIAYYEGTGDLSEPKELINRFLKEENVDLPDTYVLDLGFNQNIGWFVIEFNSVWGAGLNSCDPVNVIDCIRAATIN